MESELPDWAVTVARETVVGTMAQASPLFIERVARALVAAERRGIERAVKMAEEYVWDDHALEQATDMGRSVHYQAQEIVAAIRQIGG